MRDRITEWLDEWGAVWAEDSATASARNLDRTVEQQTPFDPNRGFEVVFAAADTTLDATRSVPICGSG